MDSKNYSPNQWVSTIVFSFSSYLPFWERGLDKQTPDYVLNHIILKTTRQDLTTKAETDESKVERYLIYYYYRDLEPTW